MSARLLNSSEKKCWVGLVREGEGRGMEPVWLEESFLRRHRKTPRAELSQEIIRPRPQARPRGEIRERVKNTRAFERWELTPSSFHAWEPAASRDIPLPGAGGSGHPGPSRPLPGAPFSPSAAGFVSGCSGWWGQVTAGPMPPVGGGEGVKMRPPPPPSNVSS